MSGSVQAIKNALLVVDMNFGLHTGALVAPALEKSVAHAKQVHVATLLEYVHLSYPILCTSTVEAPLAN